MFCCVVAATSATKVKTDTLPWMDRAKPAEVRAALLIAAMNETERLVLLQGAPGPGIGNTAAIPRLAVPSFGLEDGPSGVADWQTGVTNFPSALTVAATFDPQMAERFGAAMGAEHRAKGFHVRFAVYYCSSAVHCTTPPTVLCDLSWHDGIFAVRRLCSGRG